MKQVSMHAIEVEVHWDREASLHMPHLVAIGGGVSLSPLEFWATTERLAELGITRPEPPVVWRLLNVGEEVQECDEYWGHDGVWHPVMYTWYIPVDNKPIRRKIEDGAK